MYKVAGPASSCQNQKPLFGSAICDALPALSLDMGSAEKKWRGGLVSNHWVPNAKSWGTNALSKRRGAKFSGAGY